MANAFGVANNLFAENQETLLPGLVNVWVKNAPLFNLLTRGGFEQYGIADGGEDINDLLKMGMQNEDVTGNGISWGIEFGQMGGNVVVSSQGQVASLQQLQNAKAVRAWTQFSVPEAPIQISDADWLTMTGGRTDLSKSDTQVLSLMDKKLGIFVRNSVRTWYNYMQTKIYAANNDYTTDILGLQAGLGTGNTYCTVNRATITQFASNIDATAYTKSGGLIAGIGQSYILDIMENAKLVCTANGAKIEDLVFVGDSNFRRMYTIAVKGLISGGQYDLAAGKVETDKFRMEGARVLYDQACPAGYLFVLDLASTHLYPFGGNRALSFSPLTPATGRTAVESRAMAAMQLIVKIPWRNYMFNSMYAS